MGKKKIAVGAWAYIWGGYEEAPIPLATVVKGLQGPEVRRYRAGSLPAAP